MGRAAHADAPELRGHEAPVPAPGTVALATLKTNATQFLIQSSEYQQEADKLGAKVSDKDIDDRLTQIKNQYYGNPPGQPTASATEMEKRYQAALKQQGFTDEEVRAGIKLQLVREKVFKEVTKGREGLRRRDQGLLRQAQVAVRDARAAGKPRRGPHPRQEEGARRQHLRAAAGEPRQVRAARQEVLGRHLSKVAGGRLPGGAIKGRTVPPFDKVAFSIKTNAISKPVHTQFGWHIIEALGPIKKGTPAKPTPLAQVKENIKQVLLSTDKNDEMNKWLDEHEEDLLQADRLRSRLQADRGQDPCKQKTSTTGTTSTTG